MDIGQEQGIIMGMDRRIEKKRPSALQVAVIAAVALAGGWLVWRLVQAGSTATYRVERDRVTISTVERGRFEDFIPIRGTVTPLRTVYLDAIDGGRVERVLAEEGSLVTAGQPIVELTNTALQLDVIAREAEVSEQLNNLRNTRLALEQNRLQLKSDLVEIDYQLVRLGRLVERRGSLIEQDLIAQGDYDEVSDEYEYFQRRRAITLESQEQEERMRTAQMKSLETGISQLERNLEIARKNLRDLVIRAPVNGLLSALDAEIGESKGRGERLGQIDDVDRFKVTALVDEYYVTRVARGQVAQFTLLGASYEMTVTKVYPEIENGQFEVDLAFSGDEPAEIRRGQTLQIRLQLGESGDALLLARGGFFQSTGGAWAFVLDDAGKVAVRRPIELGRSNPRHFEVVGGLAAGDRVITSDYAAFLAMDRIAIKNTP
jgi:HlyD family secretion protein